MRVELVISGRSYAVDVDLVAGRATVDGRSFAVQSLRETATGLELEIAGEKVVVAGWPAGLERPLPELAINGERSDGRVTGATGSASPPARPGAPAASSPSSAGTAPPVAEGPGSAVMPPMPGKVLEVRVRDGETVTAGQLLLVVEAMKMRNEILAPRAGVVRELKVVVGTNVPAQFAMLRIVAEP